MRTRENARRAEELAAVVRWLRARADEALEAGEALWGKYGDTGRRLGEECKAKAVAFVEAADALERGEHHAGS